LISHENERLDFVSTHVMDQILKGKAEPPKKNFVGVIRERRTKNWIHYFCLKVERKVIQIYDGIPRTKAFYTTFFSIFPSPEFTLQIIAVRQPTMNCSALFTTKILSVLLAKRRVNLDSLTLDGWRERVHETIQPYLEYDN